MITNINVIDNRAGLGKPLFVDGGKGDIDYFYGPYKAPKDNTKWFFEYKDTQTNNTKRVPLQEYFRTSLAYCKAVAEHLLKNVNQWQIGRRVCIIDDNDTPIEYVVVKSSLSIGDNIVLELKKVSEVEGNNSGTTPEPYGKKIILKVSMATIGSTVGSTAIKVYKVTKPELSSNLVEEEMTPTNSEYDFGEYKRKVFVECKIKIVNNTDYLYTITYPDGTTSKSQEVQNKVISFSFIKGGGNYTVNLKKVIGGSGTIISGDNNEISVGSVVEGSLSNNGLRYNAINNMPTSFENRDEAQNYITANFGTTTIGEKNYFIPLETNEKNETIVDKTFINDVSNLSKGIVTEETSAFELNNIYDLSVCETVSSKKLKGINFTK